MNTNGHKERPILFSGEMVRAILDGKKTQTRRVVTHAPQGNFWVPRQLLGEWIFECKLTPPSVALVSQRYGKAGDRLWVREGFFIPDAPYTRKDKGAIFYKANTEQPLELKYTGWRPSIHMPRWASRVTLEITNVKVERLQEISGADAKAEGIDPFLGKDATAYRAAFQMGWDDLNAKRGYGWEKNPWVWVIEFKVL